MSFSKIAGVVLGSAALVAGHGYVSGAVVDGTYYGGYLVTQYPYESSPPDTIGWSDTATDLGYVDGSSYASSDIICHKSAEPGAISASVAAGGSVELQWTEWPSSHHGPVITYLANCNGDCSSVDKTTLKFFKIDESGLIDDTTLPGTWASDNLISNNNSRTVTIPSSIEAGNYVLRHEIIALHSAENSNGAQNYPQCLNLKVTGGGSDSPTGTLGTALYTNTDPGILVNIYQSLSSYTIPGPALYTGAASSSDSTTTAASVAATTTAAAATTTAAAATTTAEAATTAASSSTVASVGVISSASPVSVTPSPSATPIGSPSSIPSFSNSTRLPRPSHGRRPGHGAAPSGRPQFSAPSGTENQASTVTDYATATEYATATVSAQFTDSPNVQTPSADDTVTVTASAGGQVAASSTASASSSDSSSTSSSSSSGSTSSGSSSGSSSSSSGSSSYNSSDWSSYLSSLSAEQFLNLLRQTLKWLVSDKKVHARDLTV